MKKYEYKVQFNKDYEHLNFFVTSQEELKDYSKVWEVVKQYIKGECHSSDIDTIIDEDYPNENTFYVEGERITVEITPTEIVIVEL